MLRGHVERFEVVVVVLELGAFRDVEPHAQEDLLDALAQQRERMAMTDKRRAAGERDIDRVGGRRAHQRLFRLFERLLRELPQRVQRLPARAAILRRRRPEVLQRERDRAALAGQIPIPHGA